MEHSKDVLLLFSGGKDSFLSACNLIEEGYKVHMVTFENGTGLGSENVEHGAQRIIEHYGEDKAVFLGAHCTAGIWREFFLPYLNMKPSEVLKEYGELTVSQFNCLTCRSAMYVWSIIKARETGIGYIADGARKDQGFVIELPCMIEKFRSFMSEFSIELLLPVWDLNSNWKQKNLLLRRGFIPKTLESQCLLGAPLPGDKEPEEEIQEAVGKYFDKIVLPRARDVISSELKLKQGGKNEKSSRN